MRTSTLAPVALGAAAASGMAWAVRGRSSEIFAPSVWRGASGRRSVALTFDDGPSPSTPAILDLLAEYGVPATFFQCGVNARRLPDVAQAVAAAGHELGNHSHTHPLCAMRNRSFVRGEFSGGQVS